MFTYFPTNYVWNLSLNIALNTGGHFAEVMKICDPLLEASKTGEDSGTEDFFNAWTGFADALVARAETDLEAGNALSAGDKYFRASVYYLTAERMQSRHYAPRWDAYRKGLDAFHKGVGLGQRDCELVEIPYQDTSLPGYFVRADPVGPGPAPVMVAYNGLDSMKEMIYGSGIATELARRGISTLIVDHPGSG